ncbi:helix-turn-helix transcriptional regulator [Saccharothrix syringae]|uniref:LuxR family transcriptional regulator n=1 Tax=Saccharothrix syringae TaxID=103733 RepID=A0A5Q0H1J1_SACSY|nr:LuxR family transcriptional regulator [Saccharothrix syringae]QFZ20137.1 LuxR family transcriptional regulator [Saccharothrix syringae]
MLFDVLRTEVEARRRQVLVVSGRPGAGRTALLSVFAERARSAGFDVEWVGISRFEPTLRTDLRFTRTPLLLCVDDLHHADRASVRSFVGSVLANRTTPVILVLSVREATETYREITAELRDHRHYHHISLTTLSADGVAAFARTAFSLALKPEQAAEVLRLSGGNLNLARMVLADCDSQAAETGADCLVLGHAFNQAVRLVIAKLEPQVRAVARAIAVLGAPGTPRAVADVAGTGVAEAERAMAELGAVGLLTDTGYRHPAAAEAVLTDLSLHEAQVLHLRVAETLRGLGARALDVTRHLVAADHVDEDWSGFLVHEAVAQAVAVRDWGLVHTILRLALRGAREDESRAFILERIALVQSAVDPDACCQAFHEAATVRSELDLWHRYSPVLAEQMVRRGRGREAVAKLTVVTESGDTDLAADRLLVRGEYPALLAEWLEGADDRADEGRSARHEMAWSLATALTSPRRDREAARRATNALYGFPHATEETAPAIAAALTALVYAGESETAGSFAERFAEDSARQRVPVWQARFTAVGAEAALRRGRHREAAAKATRALSLISTQAWGVRVASPIACAVLAHLATGDRAGAAEYVNRPLPAAVFDSRHGPVYLYARGHFNLATGRVRAGLADFRSCGRLLVDWGVDRESVAPWRLAAAGALLTLGDQDGAIDLIEERIGQVEAVLGDGEEAAGAGRDRRSAVREQVFSTLVAAAVSGDVLGAVDSLLAGGQITVPAPRVPRYKIEDRYSSYLNKLSRSERQVALLAASGCSNRNIARSLSVSVSTVEQHLTRTYRKLQLAGRQELRAKLG